MHFGHGGRAMTAIWFRYELSPITVHYVEKHQPFYTYLVMVRFMTVFLLKSCDFVCYCTKNVERLYVKESNKGRLLFNVVINHFKM